MPQPNYTPIDVDKLGYNPIMVGGFPLVPVIKENGNIVIPIPKELRKTLYWDGEEIYDESLPADEVTNRALPVLADYSHGKGRWEEYTKIIVSLYGRFWSLIHSAGLTEGQESFHFEHCSEMEPVEPHEITTTIYKGVELKVW